MTVNNNPVQIGGFNLAGVANPGFFAGRIDEIAIYDRALVNDEVARIVTRNGQIHDGIYGGPGAQVPDPVDALTPILGAGLLVYPDGRRARPLGGLAGLTRIYVTANEDNSEVSSTVDVGKGRTAKAIQDAYVGAFTGIYGSRFDDLNGDGIRDAVEPGIGSGAAIAGVAFLAELAGQSSDPTLWADRSHPFALGHLDHDDRIADEIDAERLNELGLGRE